MKSMYLLFIVFLSITGSMGHATEITKENVDYTHSLLGQINRYRMQKDLNQLRLDPTLTQLAKKHSLMMFQKHKVSHNNFDERFQQAGSSLCIENVGWNSSSLSQIFEGWQQSRGHNRNMLKEEINRVGIAETGNYVTFFACK